MDGEDNATVAKAAAILENGEQDSGVVLLLFERIRLSVHCSILHIIEFSLYILNINVYARIIYKTNDDRIKILFLFSFNMAFVLNDVDRTHKNGALSLAGTKLEHTNTWTIA